MKRYEWINQVVEDLSKFAEQENLMNLYNLLQQLKDAVEQDLLVSEGAETVSAPSNSLDSKLLS